MDKSCSSLLVFCDKNDANYTSHSSAIRNNCVICLRQLMQSKLIRSFLDCTLQSLEPYFTIHTHLDFRDLCDIQCVHFLDRGKLIEIFLVSLKNVNCQNTLVLSNISIAHLIASQLGEQLVFGSNPGGGENIYFISLLSSDGDCSERNYYFYIPSARWRFHIGIQCYITPLV